MGRCVRERGGERDGEGEGEGEREGVICMFYFSQVHYLAVLVLRLSIIMSVDLIWPGRPHPCNILSKPPNSQTKKI